MLKSFITNNKITYASLDIRFFYLKRRKQGERARLRGTGLKLNFPVNGKSIHNIGTMPSILFHES